jgi:hypothetical protein
LTVDVEHARSAVDCADGVRIPDLIEKCIHPYAIFEIASMNDSTEAVTMSVLAPKP